MYISKQICPSESSCRWCLPAHHGTRFMKQKALLVWTLPAAAVNDTGIPGLG